MIKGRMGADCTEPLAAMTVVGLLTMVSLELVRSTGPLLEVAFDVGVTTAAATALLTYAGAGLLGLGVVWITRRAGSGAVVLAGVLVLAVARLVAQGVTATARVGVGLVTISLSVAVLTIVVAVLAGRDGGGRAVSVAMAAGAAAGMGMQLALGTWDVFWRHDLLGWGVTVVVLGCLVGAAELARREAATTPTRDVRRMWVLGPALGLLVMLLANSGFAASQSGTRLAIAGPVAAVGLLVAGAAVSKLGRLPSRLRTSSRAMAPLVTMAPAAAIAGVFWVSGPVVLVLLVAAQLSVFVVIAEALDRGSTQGSSIPPRKRDGAAASVVGLATILPLLVFQLDYDIPLGFANELVIVATAAVLGTATLARRHARAGAAPSAETSHHQGHLGRPLPVLLVGACLVAFVGSALAIGRDISNDPKPEATALTEPLTLVSWNLHYGVDPDAGVDLEETARSIEEHNPAIVTLQEVSRGWVLGGGTDMATWLAQRLDMRVAYAPAADRQFGNAVLTNLPTTDITAIDLPYGEGPQERSAISVDIDLPDGPLRIISVHLQNKSQHIATRLEQIDRLLEAHADAPVMVIAGDFNAQPGSPEIDTMTGTGLISAQDVSGDPTALTDPSINPDKRIDWVFGRGVSFVNTEVLADALSSDHLPLVVVFRPA